ncbi:unnamed protein product [Boreogadus saida]
MARSSLPHPPLYGTCQKRVAKNPRGLEASSHPPPPLYGRCQKRVAKNPLGLEASSLPPPPLYGTCQKRGITVASANNNEPGAVAWAVKSVGLPHYLLTACSHPTVSKQIR